LRHLTERFLASGRAGQGPTAALRCGRSPNLDEVGRESEQCLRASLPSDSLRKVQGLLHESHDTAFGGVVKPSVQTVAKIAKALGIPMEDLIKQY
jgi:hypothetical protein